MYSSMCVLFVVSVLFRLFIGLLSMYFPRSGHQTATPGAANLRTKILDLIGFDSSIIFSLRGGIPRPIGNFMESLSQAILVVRTLVGRLGVLPALGLPLSAAPPGLRPSGVCEC